MPAPAVSTDPARAQDFIGDLDWHKVQGARIRFIDRHLVSECNHISAILTAILTGAQDHAPHRASFVLLGLALTLATNSAHLGPWGSVTFEISGIYIWDTFGLPVAKRLAHLAT